MNRVIQITSLAAFINDIVYLNTKLRKYGTFEDVLTFRGQSDENFVLLPAIARHTNPNSNISLLDFERNLIELAKFKLPQLFCNIQNPIDLLALLQHHGIPTRLLDVTQNPLVALFFACYDCNKNGEVIVFKTARNGVTTYPICNAIADTYRFVYSTPAPLDDFYEKVLEQPYFLEQHKLLNNCFSDKTRGAAWIVECCNVPIFLQAQELSTRQKMQQGQFILFPNEIKETNGKYYFYKNILPIDKNNDCVETRYIIPAYYKKTLLKQLKMVGISESILFLDNIDSICKEIASSQIEKLYTYNPAIPKSS